MYAKNVGPLDRFARLVLGAALLPIGFFPLGGLHGQPLGILAIVIGTAGIGTALTGRCPGYVPFGIDTRRTRPARSSFSMDRRTPESGRR